MEMVTSGLWIVSERIIASWWNQSSIVFWSKVAESSLEEISVCEVLWKYVSLKLHHDSALRFEEFNDVDSNLKLSPH
jgi:hypothetical protein